MKTLRVLLRWSSDVPSIMLTKARPSSVFVSRGVRCGTSISRLARQSWWSSPSTSELGQLFAVGIALNTLSCPPGSKYASTVFAGSGPVLPPGKLVFTDGVMDDPHAAPAAATTGTVGRPCTEFCEANTPPPSWSLFCTGQEKARGSCRRESE